MGARWGALLVAAQLLACGGDDGGGGGGGADAGTTDPACEYPAHPEMLTWGEPIPPYRWVGAIGMDGEPFALDLEEFYCSSEWDDWDSMTLIVGAGWCSACPEYIQQVDSTSDTLLANRSYLVYLEVETADFQPATSADAKEYIDALIGDGPGVRVGDADNADPNAVRRSVLQMPSGYFIRRRDMRVLADQAQSIYVIDYGALSEDPEDDWEPTLPPFEPNCTEADEEPTEPNDSLEDAAPVEVGELEGGICMEGSDFYQVDLAGPWRADLYLNHFEGDLNLRLWVDGERIGGSTQRSNHEWIDWEGPAIVEVYGEDRASNVYTFALVER